jgi:hypothetical protein
VGRHLFHLVLYWLSWLLSVQVLQPAHCEQRTQCVPMVNGSLIVELDEAGLRAIGVQITVNELTDWVTDL